MKRFWAIFIIISHFMVTSILASAHAVEDLADGCGSCRGYETPHIHFQLQDKHHHDALEQHSDTLLADHEHEHDESGHVHLIFQLSASHQMHSTKHQQVLHPAIAAVYDDMSFAPPVPPPTR